MEPEYLARLPSETFARRPELLELAYVFVNPVEYHGPHLSLQTDYLISWGLARELHVRLREWQPELPFAIGAVLDVGVDPAPGPGSVHTPLKEVTGSVLRACKSLVRIGVRRVVFMTFHGSPGHAAAIQAGIRYLAKHGVPSLNPFNLVLEQMRDFDPARYGELLSILPDAGAREKMIREGWRDFHGGLLETSVAMVMAPASVSPAHADLPDCPDRVPVPFLGTAARIAGRLGKKSLQRELEIAADAVAWTRLRPHPGYTGAPRLASPELGRRIVDGFVRDYTRATRDVFENRAEGPRPILQWSVVASGIVS